jgi:hypothetical protein
MELISTKGKGHAIFFVLVLEKKISPAIWEQLLPMEQVHILFFEDIR